MTARQKQKIEFGDFQTPDSLAQAVCEKLLALGFSPNVIVEPTCGVGSFVLAAASVFPASTEIHGFEINDSYLETLRGKLYILKNKNNITLAKSDFFATDWTKTIRELSGSILVLGNLPWVTNSTLGAIKGENLPEKMNFLKQNGFDAMTGKSNFDISESMLLEILRCLNGRSGDIAMLVKTAVARKVLAHAQRQKLPIREAGIFLIDAKKEFNASVEACLLVVRLSEGLSDISHQYVIYQDLWTDRGVKVGYRHGLTVGDLDAFDSSSFLFGECPQKWRSGIKHDAASVMELTRTAHGLINGFDEAVDVEAHHLFPLMKGSDIGSGKPWREKFVLVTQHFVGERTDRIREHSPKTWSYLERHAHVLDFRSSSIYKNNPRFSIFGIGDYAFRPWRIAICGLYKSLKFRLIGPVEGKSVMFDDTVYYLSFDQEADAREALALITAEPSLKLLSSLIFWDEKRPVKTGILNNLDWSRLAEKPKQKGQSEMNFMLDLSN